MNARSMFLPVQGHARPPRKLPFALTRTILKGSGEIDRESSVRSPCISIATSPVAVTSTVRYIVTPGSRLGHCPEILSFWTIAC